GDAARMAAALFMRKRGGDGRAVAASAEVLSKRVIDTLKRRSAELVLETAFEQDGLGAGLSTTPLVAAMLDGRGGLAGASLALSAPLVGLGASAATYYPDVGALLRCDAVVPEHAEVANAVGAVAGNVEASAEVAVQSSDGEQFILTGGGDPIILLNEAEALRRAKEVARDAAIKRAAAAGADAPDVSMNCEEKRAEVESRDILIEARVRARAFGRPRF
ncbi:MAG: hydantoinase/oxoprolinase family protein, partial [Pseudomonadota bacterium]